MGGTAPNRPSRRRNREAMNDNSSCSSTSPSNQQSIDQSTTRTPDPIRSNAQSAREPRRNITVSPARETTPHTRAEQTPMSSSSSTSHADATPVTIPVRRVTTLERERKARMLEPLFGPAVQESISLSDTSNPRVVSDLMVKIQAFIERQEVFNTRLDERVSLLNAQPEKERENTSRRLPTALTANVREVYRNLKGNNGESVKWDLSKSFSAAENQEVNRAIVTSVRSTHTETSASLIKAAMRAHFRTKRREHINKIKKKTKDVLKEQRVRSRLNTKKNQREKALILSTSISPEDKERYSQVMTVDYMSSEHSTSESDSSSSDGSDNSDTETETRRKKFFSISTLPWRSQELGRMLHILDRKAKRRRTAKGTSMTVQRRDQGIQSTRPAPEDAPPFALS